MQALDRPIKPYHVRYCHKFYYDFSTLVQDFVPRVAFGPRYTQSDFIIIIILFNLTNHTIMVFLPIVERRRDSIGSFAFRIIIP